MQCLLCHQNIHHKTSLQWLLSWQPLAHPVVCAACWQGFTRIERSTACPGCGRAQASRRLCPDCQRWPVNQPFHNVALFTYNDAMHNYFQQYKFQGDYRVRAVFATLMQTTVNQLAGDLVLTIPVTASTMMTRGFNQVTGWLTDDLNQADGLATLAQEKGVAQSQKARQERLETPQPFKLVISAEQLRHQHVILVDDIYTTGSTMRHAADLIIENGAKSVTGLTLAR
ncbi:ComF family protein [Lactiplantibacillus paraxiangfangensis]|uniref:ComF family protein n=1 Tax=Lactiplantibacillus paraxiangfangensis TaxID=3076224 RepID=UPI0030C73BFD